MGTALRWRGVLPWLHPSRGGPLGRNRGSVRVVSCHSLGAVRLGFDRPNCPLASCVFLRVVGEAAAATTPLGFVSSALTLLRRRVLWCRQEVVGTFVQEVAGSGWSSEWRSRRQQDNWVLSTVHVGSGRQPRLGGGW
jgi:hypothetical protein